MLSIKRLLNCAAAFVIWLPAVTRGAGLVAIKDQPFHHDDGANVIVFVSMKNQGGPMVTVKTANSEFTVERQKIVGTLEILPLPATLTTETEIAPVRENLANTKAFAVRFPKSQALLKDRIANLEKASATFSGGNVLADGQWMPKAEFDTSLAASKKQAQQASLETELKGEHLPNLKTTSGKEYQKVLVRKVTPLDISVMHEAGATKIKLADLSPDLQKHFGYDPEKAIAYQAQQDAEAEANQKADEAYELAAAKQRALARAHMNVESAVVFQVTSGGVLARLYATWDGDSYVDVPQYENQKDKNAFTGRTSTSRTKVGSKRVKRIDYYDGALVFIECDASTLVDGSSIGGDVWRSGVFAYESIWGRRTIPRYSTNRADALPE